MGGGRKIKSAVGTHLSKMIRICRRWDPTFPRRTEKYWRWGPTHQRRAEIFGCGNKLRPRRAEGRRASWTRGISILIFGCKTPEEQLKSDLKDYIKAIEIDQIGGHTGTVEYTAMNDDMYKVKITYTLSDSIQQDDYQVSISPNFTPTFNWAPHLTPTDSHIIDQHSFRSPAMIVSDEQRLLTVIPDMDFAFKKSQIWTGPSKLYTPALSSLLLWLIQTFLRWRIPVCRECVEGIDVLQTWRRYTHHLIKVNDCLIWKNEKFDRVMLHDWKIIFCHSLRL